MFQFSRVGAVCALTALMAIPFGLPAESAGPFDGNYSGESKMNIVRFPRGNTETRCGGNDSGLLPLRQVMDSKIKMRWGRNEIEFSVAADGVISGYATAGAAQIVASGKITGNSMLMNHTIRSCGYSYEGKKGG